MKNKDQYAESLLLTVDQLTVVYAHTHCIGSGQSLVV
jgi:hypothetical protein